MIQMDDPISLDNHRESLSPNGTQLNRSQIHAVIQCRCELTVAISHEVYQVLAPKKLCERGDNEWVVDTERQYFIGALLEHGLGQSHVFRDVVLHTSWSECSRVSDQDYILVGEVICGLYCLLLESFLIIVFHDSDKS